MDDRAFLMHQVMLGDRVRRAAYEKSLQRLVRQGDIVLDVGAGTLVLSLLALAAGAGHVYAVEADPSIAPLARAIIEHNGLEKSITLIHADARAVDLPRKVDVVVSEMMGNLGPEEEMQEILAEVCRKNLAPGGRVIPSRLSTRLAAIEFDGEGWGVWSESFGGYSLSVVPQYVRSSAQLHFFARDPKLLTKPVEAETQQPRGGKPAGGGSPVFAEVARPGTLQAIIGYFEAELAPEITLSNFPCYPGSNWAVWVWPVRHTHVDEGDRIRLRLRRPQSVRLAEQWQLDCDIARCRR